MKMRMRSSGTVPCSEKPASAPAGSTDDPVPAFPSSIPYYTTLSLSICVDFLRPCPHHPSTTVFLTGRTALLSIIPVSDTLLQSALYKYQSVPV